MNKFNLKKINLFTLEKHYLLKRTKASIDKLTADICGLHATASETPYLSLFARLKNFEKKDLNHELVKKKSLAKVRVIRKTLFIIAEKNLRDMLSATTKESIDLSRSHMEYFGFDVAAYERYSKKIVKILKNRTLSAREIKTKLDVRIRLSQIINLMCDEGILIRLPSKQGWQSNLHSYRLFKEVFPNIKIDKDENKAKKEIIRNYIRAFGPVMIKDIRWWTGFQASIVQNFLEENHDRITKIKINEIPEKGFLMLRNQLIALQQTKLKRTKIVNFLPILDPYLMGYKDRERYLDPKYKEFVFDRSGNITKTILINGQINGVWDVDWKDPKVMFHLFNSPSSIILKKIEEEAKKIGNFIFEKEVKVKEVKKMTPLIERTAGNFAKPLRKNNI